MNDYKITYTSETGEESNAYVTERTESSARKAFSSAHKGMGLTIQSVELHRENTSATKQQERDTLAAIRKMVEELGPQSYLATAFEGCFEDADTNIDNDFADSYKRRYDDTLEKLERAKQEIGELEMHKRLMQQTIDRLQRENEALEQQAEQQTISADDLSDVIRLVVEKKFELDTEVKNAAERIVEAAGEPESAAFKSAVNDHRAAKRDLDYYSAILERLGRLSDIKKAA
ncbi:MAG: hypothetical protein K2O18_09195 [Oscillospiraceae bacterium]|nr:hypothetical protein [Oscillospiraceae bacterium]